MTDMAKMKSAVFLFALLAVAKVQAVVVVDYKISQGTWSEPYVDDSTSQTNCSEVNGYKMVQCSCKMYDQDRYAYRPCDGSVMTTNKEGTTICMAYNQAYGAGVCARAMCVKPFKLISSAEDQRTHPTATCPEGYDMIGCNMHAHHSHQMRDDKGNVSYKHEPDYSTNTCKARCPQGAHKAGEIWDGDIKIVKDLASDVNGCSVTAMCYLSDLSAIPVDNLRS